MILTASGMNVYPEDIEAELSRTPGVKEACVLGREQGDQTVVHAVLLLEEGCHDGKSIVEAANANLADHQKIQAFTIWDKPDFPRTTTMKVQRRFILEAWIVCTTMGRKFRRLLPMPALSMTSSAL